MTMGSVGVIPGPFAATPKRKGGPFRVPFSIIGNCRYLRMAEAPTGEPVGASATYLR
jgi:hypothetical protein